MFDVVCKLLLNYILLVYYMFLSNFEILDIEFMVNDWFYWLLWVLIVVICIDGCGDEYFLVLFVWGVMLNVEKMFGMGYCFFVWGVLLFFMNVNNLVIVIGCLLFMIGIGGNYIFDLEMG